MPTTAISRASRNRALIVAGSAVGHVAFLIILGLSSPTVREIFVDDSPPPPPVVVELYRPPPPPREARRTAVRSPAPSPARPRFVAPQAPPAAVAPLPMAPVQKAPAPPAATPPRTGGGSGTAIWPDRPEGELREALRRSVVGCANGEAVGLTRRERERCNERLGEGAKDAPFIPAPMAAAKRAGFDAAAAAKTRKREWRERAVPVGIDPRANAGGGSPAGLDRD